MNDREIIIKRRHNNTAATSFFALPNLLYGLNFGVLAGLVNAFLGVPFFGSFTLFFGQIFVLLCLIIRGINSAVVAVAISSLVTAIYAGDPNLIIIFALEIFFIHVLLKRGFFLLQSVMVYWSALGIPLLLVLSALTSDASLQVHFINGLTRAINALICVSVAAIFYWLLPSGFLTSSYRSKPPKLAALIFSLCMLTVTLPAILISLFFIHQATYQNEKAIALELKTAGAEIDQVTLAFLEQHSQALSILGDYLSKGANLQRAEVMLSTIYKSSSSFSSIVIANHVGDVVVASPARNALKLIRNGKVNISTDENFVRAKPQYEPIISKVIESSDFDDQVTLNIFVPVHDQQGFQGMIVGAIRLDELKRSVFKMLNLQQDFVVTDPQGKVLISSLEEDLPLLSYFAVQAVSNELMNLVPTLRLKDKELLFDEFSTQNEWRIITLSSPESAIADLMQRFLILLVCAALLLLSFGLIARQLSKKITQPLENMAKHFPDTAIDPSILEGAQISQETLTLTNRLISSHAVMNDFQQQLTEQVDNKTRQLKQLNKELYSLAQKDGLTQLLNRAGFNRFALTSYRNCIRHRITMSIILIDIDHFKHINDTRGHLFGDQCIVSVATILQRYCKRDTDIIGRFGGEEFILMIVGGEVTEHHARVKMVKESIANNVIQENEDSVSMTVSAGILSIKTDFTLDFESMIKLADDQLYLSKRTGRNKISTLVR
jgi:diguanylate cyclase (GGDEF)-like protein